MLRNLNVLTIVMALTSAVGSADGSQGELRRVAVTFSSASSYPQSAKVATVSPSTALVSTRATPTTVTVFVTNLTGSPLDAWDLTVFVESVAHRTSEVRRRHDFYRNAYFGDDNGVGAILPGETRAESIPFAGAITATARLNMIIRRDGKVEGDVDSIAEIRQRRANDARELAFWISVLDEVSRLPSADVRQALTKRAALAAERTPRDGPQAFFRSLGDRALEISKLADEEIGSALIGWQERLTALHRIAVAGSGGKTEEENS